MRKHIIQKINALTLAQLIGSPLGDRYVIEYRDDRGTMELMNVPTSEGAKVRARWQSEVLEARLRQADMDRAYCDAV